MRAYAQTVEAANNHYFELWVSFSQIVGTGVPGVELQKGANRGRT